MLRRRPGVVVITGASAGVGRATARTFARRGARPPAGSTAKGGRDRARNYGRYTAIVTVVAHVGYGAIVGGFSAGL
jgi:NAD(P)-dependent dehydrogenase (short-subunit alcohol dehydrogenase family)